MLYFFHELPKNVINSFKKRNALIHLFAILITIAIVYSGLDWTYLTLTRNDFLLYIFFQAVILGGILPIMVPIFMIIWGIYKENIKLKIAGWAVGQSALLGLTISSFYKMFTGRIEPNLADAVHDISNNFNLGFLKHGVFFGWPSSHTTVAFAIAFTVCILLVYSLNIK
jgi:membrane-associated phospholipid phosphatase